MIVFQTLMKSTLNRIYNTPREMVDFGCIEVKKQQKKQEGNSNIDCIPCDGEPKCAHTQGEGVGP